MLSRRQILRSLGAFTATALAPSPVFSLPFQRIGSPTNRAQIVDVDFSVTPYLGRLIASGIKTIGRYYDREYGTGKGEVCYHNKTKVLTRAELAAIESAGLSVFIVFQHCGHDCTNFDLANPETANKGRKDAEGAIRLAQELGQPAHTPIYFAVDFDPSPTKTMPAARMWPSIEAYFNQVNEVFARTRWEVGIYGSGTTCRKLRAGNLAKYFWVSTSLGHIGTPEFFNGGDWHIFQNATEIKRSYAPDTFDTNVVNPGQTYFGQWTSRGPALPHSAVEATEILASRAFVRKGCVHWSSPDPKKPRVASKPVRYNTTCRVMTPDEGGYHGVSMVEGDAIDGYVHKADLVTGGLWGNMPVYEFAAAKCSLPPTAMALPAKPAGAGSVEAKALPPRQ
jgi:Rv2525c-like, glycoside hydrolase-like domain